MVGQERARLCMPVGAASRYTCISQLSGSSGPFLMHKPPSLLGCLLLNYVQANLSTRDRLTLSPKPAASTKHPEKQPDRMFLLQAVPGILLSQAVWSGRARERSGFPACSSHRRQPPAASRPRRTAHTAPPRRAGRGQTAPLPLPPPPGEALRAAAAPPSMDRGR